MAMDYTHARWLVLAGLIFELLIGRVESQAKTPQCTVAAASRTNCATSGVTKVDCLKRGCCFDNSVFGVMWCFTPLPPRGCPAKGDRAARIQCLPLPVTPSQCHMKGCCFDPTVLTLATCFNGVVSVVEPPPKLCTTKPVPLGNRRQCGKDDVRKNGCHNDICCFDSKNKPNCYSPVQPVCTVKDADRINCGYNAIVKQACIDTGCCFDAASGVKVKCFFSSKSVKQVGAATTCAIGDLISDVMKVVEQWIDLFNKPQGVSTVLDNLEMYSITTYCGLYTTAIDSIVGCSNLVAGPFTRLSNPNNAAFLKTLNEISNAKSVCGPILGHKTDQKLCIPQAVHICSLLSFDLLVTFANKAMDVMKEMPNICKKTEEVVRGIPVCIGLSIEACPDIQKKEYAQLMNDYVSVADRLSQTCNSGCSNLVLFLLGKHKTCMWNLKIMYPDPKVTEYCTYAHDMVSCAWDLWKGCRLLPYEYFQNALSVMKTAFFAGGCKPFAATLKGFSFDPAYEVKLPACVDATIACAKELSFAVGVEEMLGQFGGYSVDKVKARIDTIGTELVKGNFVSFCGTSAQQTSKKNPIRDCVNGLAKGCATGTTTEQLKIVDTAVKWYDEACASGCTSMAQKIVNFRTTCPDMKFPFDMTKIALDVALAIAPNGKDIPVCKTLQHYAKCISNIIKTCTFLNNRLKQARDLLVKVVTQGSTRLPYQVYICGLKLDYPFDLYPGNVPALSISRATPIFRPLQWLTIVAALFVTRLAYWDGIFI